MPLSPKAGLPVKRLRNTIREATVECLVTSHRLNCACKHLHVHTSTRTHTCTCAHTHTHTSRHHQSHILQCEGGDAPGLLHTYNSIAQTRDGHHTSTSGGRGSGSEEERRRRGKGGREGGSNDLLTEFSEVTIAITATLRLPHLLRETVSVSGEPAHGQRASRTSPFAEKAL